MGEPNFPKILGSISAGGLKISIHIQNKQRNLEESYTDGGKTHLS